MVSHQASPPTSHHTVARGTVETGMRRLVTTFAVVPPCLAVAGVLANPGEYRQPAAAIAVWLAVLGVGAWLVPRLRRGRLSAGEAAAAIVIAAAAVAAAGALHQGHNVRGNPVDLAILGTAWLLVMVAISYPARVWIPAALLVFAVQGAMFFRDGGLTPVSLSQLAAAGYILVAVLLAFVGMRPALDAHAGMAARQAWLASKSAAERAASAAIRQERQGRLTVLEQEALPLLRGIADGRLDAAEPSVREECARHAAVLRRSLTGGAHDGALMAGLGPSLCAAAARDVPVAVQLIGDPGAPAPPVARAVLAAVDAVLGALPPQPVTLTVLASGDDVELYLTFGVLPQSLPDLAGFGRDVPAAVNWHGAVSEADSGEGCLEVSWRKDGAA